MSQKMKQALKGWSGIAARCPICGEALAVEDNGLTCAKQHHF